MEETLGLPVEKAEALLSKRGISCRVVKYQAKRELENADDWRVVRCAIKNDVAELVACGFRTEFGYEEA